MEYWQGGIKTPIASICLDDGTEYQYDNALPIIKEFNVNVTWALCYGLLGKPWPFGKPHRIINMNKVKTLINRGDEIADHSHNHICNKDYIKNKFKTTTFVYPRGIVVKKKEVTDNYLCARGCGRGYYKKNEPFDLYNMPIICSEEHNKDWDWGIYYFHLNVDTELRPLLEHLESKGIEIKTIEDAVEELF